MAEGKSVSESPQRTDWVGPDFSDCTSLVTFIVGPNSKEEKFVVHKEHICHSSPVLKAAFNSSFVEGQTHNYRLDDILPGTFRLFVQWLYEGKFKMVYYDPPITEAVQKKTDDRFRGLCQLWILAERLIIPRLQNQVMKVLVESEANTAWIPLAYAGTTLGSPLRQFVVDTCLYESTPDWFTTFPDHFPNEMLLEFAASVRLTPGRREDRYTHDRIKKSYFVKEDGVENDNGVESGNEPI